MVSDSVHELGGFFLIAISEDFGQGDQLPASAAFRSVTVATRSASGLR
jgi:hypothetical protein